MIKKGFTLAEVMVSLTVLGVLAAVLIPTITSLTPNKNKMLFKKAYYIAENIVNELVNNETYYPDNNVDKPQFMDESAINVTGISIAADDHAKFCKLFATKVNTIGVASCIPAKSSPIATVAANLDSGNFSTTDGITWHIPTNSAFNTTDAKDITVDVNGTSKYDPKISPNCTYNSVTCKTPDQFVIHVYYNGRLFVDGEKEKEYLGSTLVK